MRDDVTVCIPTFRGREMVAQRAARSAEGQAAAIVVHRDEYVDRFRAYVTWWEAIYRAKTEYVVLLFDDDWLEPGCVDGLRDMMRDGVAYVFADANIRKVDGTSRANLAWPEPTGHLPADLVEQRLLEMHLTISPGCCLFRRSDALSCLLVGGVPLLPCKNFPNAGADLLMVLLPLLKYPMVGWCNKPLLNFDAGPQSTTMEALSTKEGREELAAAYANARMFYLSLKESQCE